MLRELELGGYSGHTPVGKGKIQAVGSAVVIGSRAHLQDDAVATVRY